MNSPFFAIHERRMFMSVSAATLILENSERDVYGMIEDGTLPYAVDISQPGSKRRCARILTRTVFDLRAKITIKIEDWSKIVARILPQQRGTLSGPEIARMLHADSDQITLLIKARCMELARPRTQTFNEPAVVTKSSFERFLIERLIS